MPASLEAMGTSLKGHSQRLPSGREQRLAAQDAQVNQPRGVSDAPPNNNEVLNCRQQNHWYLTVKDKE